MTAACKLCGVPIPPRRWWQFLRSELCADAHECLWRMTEATFLAKGVPAEQIEAARIKHLGLRP